MWMLISAVGFTAHLALAKLLSADYDPALLAFYRTVIALIWSAPFIFRSDLSAFKTQRFPLILVRSLFGTLGFMLGFYAISADYGIPLSQFNALSFSRSLFMIVLAALLLREKVGSRRWVATAIGFLGVLIMVRPETGASAGTLLALGAAAFLAGAIVLVKILSKDHSPLVLLTYSNLLSTFLLGLYLLMPWSWQHWALPANWYDFGLIAGMSLAGLIAQSCYITAMSRGEASFLSPLDYVRLPMTAVVDWVIFQEFPGPLVWLGAGIIVTSTLYITFREAQASKTEVKSE